MKRLAIILSFLCLPLSVPAAAEELVADLSDHLIEITMGFEGAELLLFGAVEGDGDIVVLVHGPTENLTVRRKAQVGPFWMNLDEMSFAKIPAFYRVMSSRPLGNWLPDAVRERHQIGVENLRLPPRGGETMVAETGVFREALVRRKQVAEHYGEAVGTVKLLSKRLFRTDVSFPINVPVGKYTVEVFLVQGGVVVSAETIPLYISKTGALAEIFFFAQDYAAIYGILAIIFAVLAGLGANMVFRKM
jgi:uncharacterized protein (TIGR02186 family)